MKNLYIYGTGGFAKEVAWLVKRINENNPQWNILGFIDDFKEIGTNIYSELKVVGNSDELLNSDENFIVCAVGKSELRKKIVKMIQERYPNIKFATLIDPSVYLDESIKIGEGSIICAGSIITVDITIGSHTIINLDSTIGHDVQIGDYVTIYPSVNVSGSTIIGNCSEIGTGTQIIQMLNIGENCIIGAGAVVVKDIPEKCTAVGCPAKPIKFFE